jgi:hypothetical protein
MARNWTCHKCGEVAEYKSCGKAYCEIHWVEYLSKTENAKRKKR